MKTYAKQPYRKIISPLTQQQSQSLVHLKSLSGDKSERALQEW